IGPVGRYSLPSSFSRPRSISMRTVSTAYSGMPSDRSRICTTCCRDWCQGLQEERREVAPPGAPVGSPLQEIGAGHGEDEDGMVPRPLQQVLDEVEQRS